MSLVLPVPGCNGIPEDEEEVGSGRTCTRARKGGWDFKLNPFDPRLGFVPSARTPERNAGQDRQDVQDRQDKDVW